MSNVRLVPRVMSAMSLVLLVLGSIAGLAWAVLGVCALKYLPSASEDDRTYGWSLWWFVDGARYVGRGKRLCQLGWLAFIVALASWLGWALLR
jgi:hypothetical protein